MPVVEFNPPIGLPTTLDDTVEGLSMTAVQDSVMSDDMLARFAARAPVYDRENRFFSEDFEELRQAGYLKINIPREFGGLGMNLVETCREQRRLAYRAP